MKKTVILILLLILFTVSGCGTNKTKVLKCSNSSEGTNMNSSGDVVYTFKNDKVVKATVDITFKDITVNNISSVWDSFKTQFTEQNLPVEEPGFKRTVKSDDKNYTFTVTYEIDYTKISKETMEKYEIEDYSEKTYDELKKEALDEGYVCK